MIASNAPVISRIGEVPASPDDYYKPLAAVPDDVIFELTPVAVPSIDKALASLRDGRLPGHRNAGLVSLKPFDTKEDHVDDQDLVAFDLATLVLGRNRGYLMSTDRNGVEKETGRVWVPGAVVMTGLTSGLVTVTHVSVPGDAPWAKKKTPYLPARTGNTLRSLGLDKIELEVTESMPGAGIATIKRRTPVYSFPGNNRTR